HEQPHGFVRDAVLRVIKIQTNRLGRQLLAALCIVSEQIAQMPVAHLLVVRRERFPRRSFGERFNRRLHAAAPFVVSSSVNGIVWSVWRLDFRRGGCKSSSHNRKPPRKALTLSPPRHPSGSLFSFLTLPPPRTTSSRSRAWTSWAMQCATSCRHLFLPSRCNPRSPK